MNFIKKKNEIKVPTRVAPPPPNASKSWSSSIFGPKYETRLLKENASSKKEAPPRPPPPKLPVARDAKALDTRNGFEAWSSDCLIDWLSPPSSPSSVTKSNSGSGSDAISVNSFGSDSVNASSASGSGSASNVESGFEDDFDLLCASTASKPFDPWSPPIIDTKNTTKQMASYLPNKPAMPTIIRAKPERPKVPKILEKKYEMNALTEVFEKSRMQSLYIGEEDEGWDSDSPPIPTCPPPAPPPQLRVRHLNNVHDKRTCDNDTAVAIYDYHGAQGDLSFQQGDRVRIIRHIDSNWIEASLNGHTGIAPVNYLQLLVSSREESRVATALYEFKGETWEDLSLQQGDAVTLLYRVNAEWLFGQVADRRGQFPATFVDHVPLDLQYSIRPDL